MSKSAGWAISITTFAFFGCFFLWPLWSILCGQSGQTSAFFGTDGHFTLDFISEVFRNRVYVEGLLNSFLLGIASTALTASIAIPVAFIVDRYSFPGKKAFSALLLAPMILPPFVGAIGFRQIFGQYGAFNALLEKAGFLSSIDTIDWLGNGRFWGVVLLNALHLYPILFLNLQAALASLDPAMEEAAENLGCSGFRKFRKITLPLIMPGLFSGGILVFIFAFTELGVPLMFDYTRVTSVQIFYGIKEIAGNPFPFALVAVMLAATASLYVASRFFFGRSPAILAEKAGTQRRSTTLSPLARISCTAAIASVCGLALLPHLGVILVSVAGDWYHSLLPSRWTLEHYRIALAHGLTVPSIFNSLKYASISTVADIILGVGIAWVIIRSQTPGRWALDALSMMPLAVPGIVLAFGYLSMTQTGRFFAFLNPSIDPTPLLVIAYAVRRLPYVVRSAAAGLQQTSVTLEEAAQNLGASPKRVAWKITLPLISPNLLAGAILAFSFAMLEVSDSLLLAQRQQDFPITKAIYELFQILGEGRYIASALGVWAMAFLGVALLLASRLLGRRLGSVFRM